MTGPTADAEVPAFWESLGLPGLADLDVHFLPPRLLRAAAGDPSLYRWSDADLLSHLDLLGVRAFTALAYANKPTMAADLNTWTLDFAAQTSGCVPSATFYPETGVNRYTRAAIDAGARVFSVHLRHGGFNPAHALLDAVWGVLADEGIPVVVDLEPSMVAAMGSVLRRHPRLPAVFARMGAPDYIEVLELAERYERVGLDTATCFTSVTESAHPFPRARLRRLEELGHAGRLFFGTDFPNLSRPYAEQLAALAGLDLGDAWLRAVLWHNATALLNLGPPSSACVALPEQAPDDLRLTPRPSRL